MADIEIVQSPQRDWWVVLGGRVIALYLRENGEARRQAFEHAGRLREDGALTILNHGTTWRSRAFDHLWKAPRIGCCKVAGAAAEGDDGEGLR